MKKSKKPKHEDGVDMISNLPDDVLQSILSRLQGTEEAIRTSIFSRRWRKLWTLVPSIDIDYARGCNRFRELDSNRFIEFVNWVLLNQPLHLDSFHLRCENFYDMSTIGPWIDATVMRKVKVIDLMFWPTIWCLPHSLVTCGSLEVLRLCTSQSPLRLPMFKGFLPALRVLELNDVYLCGDDYNVVNYFLESCPWLEDLCLIDCHVDSLVISSTKLKNLRIDTPVYSCKSLEICCPKLEFLKLTGDVGYKFLFEGLDSLERAVIHLGCLYKKNLDFFSGISHVQFLCINDNCITRFFNIEGNAPISLHNLNTLEITYDGKFKMDVLIRFLTCLPDLESLHLIIPKDLYRLDDWKLDDAETVRVLTSCLKKVEFIGNALKELVFCWKRNKATFYETMKEVSNFHKASSIVKLTVVFDSTQPD